MMKTPVVTARLPTEYLEQVDADVAAEKYPNRAQAIVSIVRGHYSKKRPRKP